MTVELHKFHGYGNDFLVAWQPPLAEEDLAAFTQAACHRHVGVGADGCVFLSPADERGRFAYRIFNRDGSEAGMSGNGARCACAFIHQRGLAEDKALVLATRSGDKRFELLEAAAGRRTYRCSLGRPDFRPGAIPFKDPGQAPSTGRIVRYPLRAAGEDVEVTALSMGNPQCQVLVDVLPQGERFRRLGAALERHPAFPERANVGFARVEAPDRVSLKIWERGVGPTHSSGTGSSAAAVAAILNGRCRSPVKVSTETGTQVVQWSEGEEVVLTGDAEYVAEIHFPWNR